MNKYPPLVNISAIGFADAWQRLVKKCMNEGALKRRFYGKSVNTYDIVSLTEIRHPFLEPMLHLSFPTKEKHLNEYLKQWERNYDWKKQGFEYNYMDRLIHYPVVEIKKESDSECYYVLDNYYNRNNNYDRNNKFIDQLKVIREKIAERISKGGECLVSNRDQVITWIPDRDMFVIEDQPCLQRIWFQVWEYPIFAKDVLHDSGSVEYLGNILIKKGKGEFHVTWRSRDLFNAWNSNMIGLMKMLEREIFSPNNIEIVRVVDFCNSNHIYESDWEEAKNIKMVSINPQLVR